MNILIDTNILIPLEDPDRQLDSSLAELYRLCEINHHSLLLHPCQKEDIQRDKDEKRRDIVLSRMAKYKLIPYPPMTNDQVLEKYGWRQSSENDNIDNLLLYSICRGAAHFLITNDKEIHKKARSAQIQEQVHYPQQFLAFLKLQTENEFPIPFGIEDRFLHEFDVKQPFFDSLREGYGQTEFNKWYLRVARDHRKAWCVTEDELLAICIYKEENKPIIVKNGNPLDDNALKLCTFKVGISVRGRKLGERLLFTAFKYAIENKIAYIFLHTYGKEHEMLVSLCSDYGFKLAGKHENGRDDVYLKKMNPPKNWQGISAMSYLIDFFPHFWDDKSVDKFIVPIRPGYHDELFPDTSETSKGLFSNVHSMYGPQANTIKKAYICHSNTKELKSGDILLFYRSGDRKSIECSGVVEQIYRGQDLDKVVSLVSKRTVYSKEKIQELLKRDTLVILFRFTGNFAPVSRNKLKSAGIDGPIQSIRKITHEQYLQCFPR
ncbi:MAG: N-acetyltransferase [Deltaproteobacteria bacterium]|nr:N-acetyltransferase [Deltaproteobacteria bacterium]